MSGAGCSWLKLASARTVEGLGKPGTPRMGAIFTSGRCERLQTVDLPLSLRWATREMELGGLSRVPAGGSAKAYPRVPGKVMKGINPIESPSRAVHTELWTVCGRVRGGDVRSVASESTRPSGG